MQKYLEITLYDNDFTGDPLGEILYSMMTEWEKYPDEEEDLETLKPLIQHLWYSLHNIQWALRALDSCIVYNETRIDTFKPELRIVTKDQLTDWENGEKIYVPLFPGGKSFIL